MQAVKGYYDKKAAKAAEQLAKEQQKAGMQLVNELDYEPMYASERVPTYQRSQSPIARSFLESVLAGNNPRSTFSGAPNAKLTKARQQTAQDRMFGTMDQRVAAQRAMEQQTPWKVTPPERKVNPNRGTDPGAAQWIVENSDLAGSGATKAIDEAILSTGNDLRTQEGKGFTGFTKPAIYRDGIQQLLQTDYKGDPDRLAADIRAAGGIEKLFAQLDGKKR